SNRVSVRCVSKRSPSSRDGTTTLSCRDLAAGGIKPPIGGCYILPAISKCITRKERWEKPGQQWAVEKLERSAVKVARCVLRGVRPLTAQEITSEKLRLDNSVRATQQAERLGKPLGLKLADKSSASANQKRMTDQPCVLW